MRNDATRSPDDVAVLRDTARAQRVVIDDLNHRMKNLLMVVQAMAIQSFRDDRPLACSLAAFGTRLRALARAHDLLLCRPSGHMALEAVVAGAVAPHDPDHERVSFGGPGLVVDPETAVSVTMAVHELLTNATKYGALSVPDGTIAIEWSFDPSRVRGEARIEWKERGGPLVSMPARRGFGTCFIEKVAGRPAGMPAIRFEPDGVRAIFDAPASAV